MKLTVPYGSVSVAGSGIMTSSHPITAGTPEGSSYGAIGTVSSRTGNTGSVLSRAGEGTLRYFKARKTYSCKLL